MRKKLKLFFVILIVLISACKKEKFNSSGELLSKIYADSKLFYEYTYNDSKKILEEKSRFSYTKHNYQDGKLISSDTYTDPRLASSSSDALEAMYKRQEWVNPSNTDKTHSKSYLYDNNGRFIKVIFKRGYSNYIDTAEYEYDRKNRIGQRAFYENNKKTNYTVFNYDNKGNLIKELAYSVLSNGESRLSSSTEYQFDDKHNPYKAFSSLMMPGQYTNTNNITRETYVVYNLQGQSAGPIWDIKNTYMYNPKGYPTARNNSSTYHYY